MFKLSLMYVVVLTLVGLVITDEIALSTVAAVLNETLTTATTVATSEVTSETSQETNPVINTNHNLTMYAKKEANLIVNGSVSVGRNISPEIKSTVGSSNFVMLVVVSVIVALCLVGVILGAIYVTKKRLFVWTLNSGKKSDVVDGANGVLTNASSENGSVNKCEGVIETKTEVVGVENEAKLDEVTKEEKVADQVEKSNLTEQKASSSLVVNVLNECKLSENTSTEQVDPEKQPLNNNE